MGASRVRRGRDQGDDRALQQKGWDEADATVVMNLMKKYPDFFVDHMLVEELGMLPPGDDPLWKQSFVMFIAFVIFGLVPLFAYLAFSTFVEKGSLFGISCGLTACALFSLGGLSSRFSASPWW